MQSPVMELRPQKDCVLFRGKQRPPVRWLRIGTSEQAHCERTNVMNKLILAAAAAATVFGAGSTAFAPEAEAGMRIGFGFRHHVFRPHFHTPPTFYRAPDEDEVRIKRRIARSKPQPEKKAVPLVKFADGTGPPVRSRQQGVVRRQGPVLVGQARRSPSRAAPGSTATSTLDREQRRLEACSTEAPELVSCDGVKAFVRGQGQRLQPRRRRTEARARRAPPSRPS